MSRNILKFLNYDHTVWKNEKFTLTEKKFCQINYVVISLVKQLYSRKFCQICVRVNFHSVDHTLWKKDKISYTEKTLSWK